MIKQTYWQEHGKNGFYQMGDNPVRSYLIELMKKLKIKTLLDVGCGSGPMYELIAEKYPELKYVGSDYSDSFMKHCSKEFPKVSWVVDDMRKLKEFRANEFDMLLYLHSLDHVGEDWIDAIDQANRVCSKYTMIVLWRPFSANDFNMSSHPDFDDSHLVDFHQGSLEAYIKTAGFKTIMAKEMYHGKQYNYIYLLERKDD